ncbi:conserved hypothetical protein [Luteimonas sp. 9C]|uniref:glycosyltransferase family 2 protein n=1 Tax=Luteimonas sp. 9C TaxID=2653148 RepID=UPI0012F41F49|nr:glycosyltransferase [Luteimonas sp. 9C]VXA94576.1 conserved hypothetical protein [Luteimonas sp. 9C]
MKPDEELPLAGLSLHLMQARREVARLRAEVDGLRASTSWRLTSPLRFIAEKLRDRPKMDQAKRAEVGADPRIPVELLRIGTLTESSGGSFRIIDAACQLSGLVPDAVIEILSRHADFGSCEWNFSGRKERPVALISGPALATELAFDVPVLRLFPTDAVEVLRESAPEFLILDMDFHDFEPAWRQALFDPYGPIQKVLDQCALLKVPVLTWFRCDPGQYANLRHWACEADRVYAIDDAIHALLEKDVGASKVRLLEPVVQPRLHNPLVTDALAALKPHGKFLMLHDALGDVCESAGKSTHGACVMTWLIDSYWELPESCVQTSTSNAHVAMGGVSSGDKLVLSKITDAELFNAVANRPRWKVQQDMLKAAACGSLVVAEPDIAEVWPLRDSQAFATSLEECVTLAADVLGAAAWRRKVIDEVSGVRTMRNALMTMRSDIDRLHYQRSAPLISCLLITRRPERLRGALENFRRQLYPNCELIMVLHGHHVPDIDLSAKGRRVMALEAPTSVGLGDCLNLAAARASGDFWAKLDDDDYYAPEYLTRMHALIEMAPAEVVGMPLLFTHFESDDTVYCDVPKLDGAFRFEKGWRSGGICGATLAGRTEILRRIPFRSDRRRGVDSRFLDDCSSEGVRIAVGDGFGFVCHRSADISQHTWEGDEKGVRARGFLLPPSQRALAGVSP